jgi:hypothetical protein
LWSTKATTIAAAIQHLHVAHDDLRRIPLLPTLIIPLPRLQTTFDKDLAALLQILTDDLSQLAPEHEAMPLGTLLTLAFTIVPTLVGRQGDVGHRGATRCVANFGITPQIADEDNLVDAPGHGTAPES